MATWFVNSGAGGTGAGTSWANACTTLAAAITLSAAGDDFNVLSTHSESQASALTLTFKGTAAAPNRVFSCTNTHSPAQAGDLTPGATIATTGANSITLAGYAYIYGVTFKAGSGSSTASILGSGSASTVLVLDSCQLWLNTTSTSALIQANGAGSFVYYRSLWLNTTVRFGSTSQSISFSSGVLDWRNTASAVSASGSAPSALFTANAASNRQALCRCVGVDLSQVSGNLVGAITNAAYFQFSNCKLNASVTPASTQFSQGAAHVDVINSDSGSAAYRQERYGYEGTLTTSTSVYNNASDGVTPISWQVATSANASRTFPFECFEIVQWVAAGTYSASVVQCTSATASLTSADVWVDAQAMDSASYPITGRYSSGPATQLTAGSALAAGTWGTGSAGNDYKLQVPSFTTAIDGFVRFTVYVAKASTTVYIDPAVTVA